VETLYPRTAFFKIEKITEDRLNDNQEREVLNLSTVTIQMKYTELEDIIRFLKRYSIIKLESAIDIIKSVELYIELNQIKDDFYETFLELAKDRCKEIQEERD